MYKPYHQLCMLSLGMWPSRFQIFCNTCDRFSSFTYYDFIKDLKKYWINKFLLVPCKNYIDFRNMLPPPQITFSSLSAPPPSHQQITFSFLTNYFWFPHPSVTNYNVLKKFCKKKTQPQNKLLWGILIEAKCFNLYKKWKVF
jgi:hypothetical protein